MKPEILFAIWLSNNTTLFIGAYRLELNNKIYYTDSISDMEKLYEIFTRSDYYLNSEEVK